MLTKSTLTKVLILGFMVLVGFALAMAFYYGSFIGIVLATVSLLAGIYFLYILSSAKRELAEYEAARERE